MAWLPASESRRRHDGLATRRASTYPSADTVVEELDGAARETDAGEGRDGRSERHVVTFDGWVRGAAKGGCCSALVDNLRHGPTGARGEARRRRCRHR